MPDAELSENDLGRTVCPGVYSYDFSFFFKNKKKKLACIMPAVFLKNICFLVDGILVVCAI